MQLDRLLQTPEQKYLLRKIVEPLNRQSADDFCLSGVAYIRFGVKRRFESIVLRALFCSFCDELDNI